MTYQVGVYYTIMTHHEIEAESEEEAIELAKEIDNHVVDFYGSASEPDFTDAMILG